jgi:hypothetical protein
MFKSCKFFTQETAPMIGSGHTDKSGSKGWGKMNQKKCLETLACFTVRSSYYATELQRSTVMSTYRKK